MILTWHKWFTNLMSGVSYIIRNGNLSANNQHDHHHEMFKNLIKTGSDLFQKTNLLRIMRY